MLVFDGFFDPDGMPCEPPTERPKRARDALKPPPGAVSLHRIRILAEDPVMHNKTKHILRKELKIRELVESGEVKVEYVESLKNFADFFTKPLPRKEFESFRKEIMNDTA